MKGQKKKQNGITLIALVISIIIMLILAGVSINMTIGDSGIITQARRATYMQSCAVLEDWLGEQYVNLATSDFINNGENSETQLGQLMDAGYNRLFFHTSEGYCLKKPLPVTLDDGTQTTQTYVFYLLIKENLPEEIRKSVQGADNLDSKAYRKLNGCYGVTSDLQVYFCENGLDSIIGLTLADINADSPDIVAYDSESLLAQIINGGSGNVTNQDLKTVKELTIDSTAKLELLKEFSNLKNLKKVIFSGITIPNIDGISDAEKLEYVKFVSCSVQNYRGLQGATNLKELYLFTPGGKNTDVANLCDMNIGIGGIDFPNLEYFGIVGDDGYYLNSTSRDMRGGRYGVTDISGLSNFSDTTKEAIRFVNLQGNQITDISSLSGFKNVYFLRMEYNAISTFNGIQNMSDLHYLIAPVQYSGTLSDYTLGSGEGDTAGTTDALDYIYKDEDGENNSLYYVDLRSNENLKYVDGLSNCLEIRFLYLGGCLSLKNAGTIKDVFAACGADASIDGAFGLEVVTDNSILVDFSQKTLKINEFEKINNNTSLEYLNLTGINLLKNDGTTELTASEFNEEINSVLKTCTSLKYLKLRDLPNLTTIDFVNTGNVTGLVELDLIGTGVTSLASLNQYALNLRTLRLSNTAIDITTIQPTINNISRYITLPTEEQAEIWDKQSFWDGKGNSATPGIGNTSDSYGFICTDFSLYKQLEDCTNITALYYRYQSYWVLDKTQYINLTECTQLTDIYSWGYGYKMLLPTSIKNYERFYAIPPVFSSGMNADKIIVRNYGSYIGLTSSDWTTFFSSLNSTISIDSLTLFAGSECTSNLLSLFSNSTGVTIREFSFEGTDPSWGRSELKTLEGLRYLNTNALESLSIRWNWGLNDITELSYLTKLKSLNISNTNINSMSSFAGCTLLENLDISNTKITDISVMTAFTKLKSFKANDDSIRFINSLEGLTDLEEIEINNNSVNDIYALKNLKKLETLYMEGNSLTDMSSHNGVGYETLDILYDLNYQKGGALKNLYIDRNSIDDVDLLLDLDFEEKSGF